MNKKLTKKVSDVLTKYSNKAGVARKTLVSEYLKIREQEAELNPDLSIDDLDERCLLILRGTYKGKARSKAVKVQGFFIGDSFPYDANGKIRNTALRAKNANFTQAKIEGLINEAGEVLDTRPTINVFGKEVKNPRHRDVLLEDWRRRLYGVFKNGNDWTYGMLNMRGYPAKNTIVEYFTPCEFVAMNRGTGQGYLTLNQSKYTEFQEIKTDWDIHDIIMETFGFEIKQVSELDDHYNNTKDAWDAYVVTIGNVQSPIRRTERWTVFELEGSSAAEWEENSVTCFAPRAWEIDFVEYSTVLILGRLNKRRARGYNMVENEEEAPMQLGINVYGIYPIPGKTRTQTAVQPIEAKQVKFGWKSLQ